MPPKTDRERLAHFVQLIGAEPREAVFDNANHLTKLNLAGLNLRELPPEIGDFARLEMLILGLTENKRELSQTLQSEELGNELTTLPNEILSLTHLQTLAYEHNQLTSLPSNLCQIVSLRWLSLANNKLRNLPSDFAKFVNLEELWLHKNQLNRLPFELSKLANLRRLSLYNNQLQSLPFDFVQPNNQLQYLDLTNNQLSSLPSAFTYLVNLHTLWLPNNQLDSLPPDFAKLVNLQKLSLAENRLMSLPPDFGKLINLRELWLNNNQLTSLPTDFHRLVLLNELSLSDNQLSDLPLDFAKLFYLQTLYLSNNQLRSLPSELGQCINLRSIELDNNPLRTPPPEIVRSGLVEIREYLRSLQGGAVARYEAKLLLVGEGKGGKSSVMRALRGLPFDKDLPTTHGIAVEPYPLPYPPQMSVTMTLNVWDFGGQQIYHTTHQFFMTKRSLYLLVWNARGDTDQGRLDHWLRNIQVLAPNAPVLLVATHIDERPADFNFARFQAAYPQLVGSIGVSNKTGAGIAELRQLIASEAAKLELMEQQWPQSWVQVETALQQAEHYHIKSTDYVAICAQNGVTRPSEQATLAGYLHDLGKLLYFQEDDTLSDFVILKPNWLTQTMARVLDDAVTRDQNAGVLYHHDFRRLWPEHEANMHYGRWLYPLFHRLLERFLLCYRLEDDAAGRAQSLAPLLLPHTPPANLPAWATVLPDQPAIRMCFKLDFVPPGIMSWFIVLSHHYSQGLHWREGVRLRYEGHEADVVLNASTRELWLQVRGPAPSNFFSLLNHMINDRIIQRYFAGLRYERQIPCCCGQCRQTPDAQRHFFDYDRLAAQKQRGKRLAIVCQLSDEEVSILELLEGIHHSTYDRIEAKLDALHAQVAEQHDLLVQNLQLSEQLTREATRMWNLLTDNLSSEAPSTFLLMPGARRQFHPRNLFDTDFTLYLLCQHPAAPHLVKGEKGYAIPHSHEWWVTVAPWLRELVKYLKYVPKASGVAAAYDEAYYKTIELNVELFKTALEITPDLSDNLARHEMERIGDLGKPLEGQGAALRALHLFLKEVDPAQHWCNLRKVATNDGNILWLCAEHAALHGI